MSLAMAMLVGRQSTQSQTFGALYSFTELTEGGAASAGLTYANGHLHGATTTEQKK